MGESRLPPRILKKVKKPEIATRMRYVDVRSQESGVTAGGHMLRHGHIPSRRIMGPRCKLVAGQLCKIKSTVSDSQIRKISKAFAYCMFSFIVFSIS